MEFVTKDDLENFRKRLLDDIKLLVAGNIKNNEENEWLKSRDVRKILKASPGTLQTLRISGKLKARKILGSWYYSSESVECLFNNGVQ